MKTEKPHGKVLTFLIIGMLLATAIIGGLIYVLESSRKHDFKDPIDSKPLPTPETLSPKKPAPKPRRETPPPEPEPVSDNDNTDSTAQEREQPDRQDKKQEDKRKTRKQQREEDDETGLPEIPGVPDPLPQKKDPAKSEHGQKSDRQKTKADSEETAGGKSGRDAREAQRKQAEDLLNGRLPAKTDSGKGKSAAAGKGRVIVQAGSYGSRDKAEIQRARLARAGIKAEVAETTVQGKTMYRVQTAPINTTSAADIRQKLDDSGIDSFSRPAD